MNHHSNLIVLSLVFLGLAVPAEAQEPPLPSALRTAEKHASLAARAQGLTDVRLHLHQVLNCLEGPRGPDYDPNTSDPCGGTGALEGLPAGSGNRARAQKAIDLARVGVTFHDFKPAHYTAQAVQAVLEEATGRTGRTGSSTLGTLPHLALRQRKAHALNIACSHCSRALY